MKVSSARPSSARRGYGGKWQRESKAFLAANGGKLCVCKRPATVVDHIKPHRGDMKLFWDRGNWQPLCGSCHSRKTARQDGGFGNTRDTSGAVPVPGCDVHGRPIDPNHPWNKP